MSQVHQPSKIDILPRISQICTDVRVLSRGHLSQVYQPSNRCLLFCWCSSCSGKRQSRAETAAPPGLAAWVWQECHTLLICAHPCHLWEALLCKRFCVFGAFRGSFFTACSVGAAETAAPPGGIHRSSVQISPHHHHNILSPSHHLNTLSLRTQPSAGLPRTAGMTSSPPAAR